MGFPQEALAGCGWAIYPWDTSTGAFEIDPAAVTWQEYAGLTGPYTYSDMTGWGLSLVTPG